MSNIALNKKGWKIKTDTGFVDFHGISEQGIKRLYKLTFDDGSHIEVTDKHVFFTTDGIEIQTREISLGLELLGIENKIVTSIEFTKREQTYDIVESENHTYFANGLLCHNCIFLSSDALLIDSIFLASLTNELKNVKPSFINKKEIEFWEEIRQGETYLVAVDPATGTGEDFSVVVVFHFPSLKQVAQYRSNTMSTNNLYGVLKNLFLFLDRKNTNVHFSIENNGVGEGIIALYENDETCPENADFVCESGKDRKGMTTTAKSKMKACVDFKEMLEKRKIQIKSQILLAELKAFARKRGAYEAQKGSTDDCVAACLIILRILAELASYDQTAFDKLYSAEYETWGDEDWDGYGGEYDENDEGLPFIISG